MQAPVRAPSGHAIFRYTAEYEMYMPNQHSTNSKDLAARPHDTTPSVPHPHLIMLQLQCEQPNLLYRQ